MKKFLIPFIIILFINTTIYTQSQEIKHLLILDSQASEPYRSLKINLIKELNILGYKEGKSIIIDYEVLGNFQGRGYNILRAKSDIKYDAIFLNGTIAGIAAKTYIENENTIKEGLKFVFANITDPIGIGLIENLNTTNDGLFVGKSYMVDIKTKLRLIQKLFGKKINIGYIYSEMPQSMSYNSWLKEALQDKEFEDITIIFREVQFVKSSGGHKRMTLFAKDKVLELNDTVDLFMASNDQMGISTEFSTMVFNTATKPLVGLHGDLGVAFAFENDIKQSAKDIAIMIDEIFKGKQPSDLISTNSVGKLYLDEDILKGFNIQIPEFNLEATLQGLPQ